MALGTHPKQEDCTCLAVRQAARQITQFYDRYLAPSGLRTSQYSVLARLKRRGPMTINELASALVMDRTTLGRNVLPLEREGLISIAPGRTDKRRRELQLTEAGEERYLAARDSWIAAQSRFDEIFGTERTTGLRSILREVTATELEPELATR
jgi:DNA-binding MarR family transcriptional regulator